MFIYKICYLDGLQRSKTPKENQQQRRNIIYHLKVYDAQVLQLFLHAIQTKRQTNIYSDTAYRYTKISHVHLNCV